MPARWRLALAVALVSAAALAWQLLLVRWLAIAHWHPFAVVIISLALLGHGASGTALSLLHDRWQGRFEAWFAACALGFALSTVVCLLLARAIPFNGLELAWNPRQLGWLSALYLCLSLPFLFAASCFGLAFARHGAAIPALYGADLLGAGAGAVLALALAWLGPVETMLPAVALLAPLAAVLVAPRPRAWLAAAAVVALLAACAATRVLAPTVNPFKPLAKALLVRDARIVAQRHGPQGWLAVVASPRAPLRQAPGLSLSNLQEPVPQLGLFVDGDGPQPITRAADADALAYLGRTTSALPYALSQRPRVLVLGGGGGDEVRQALVLGARAVDVVDANAQRIGLLRERFARHTGGLYRGAPQGRVRVHHADARAFVRTGTHRYDLIVLAPGTSFASGSAGAQAVAEDYGATVEALRAYYADLAPGGLLAVTRWEKQPPRDALKLFATAVAALRAEGVVDPGRQLLVLRNWDASTLLLRRGAFPAPALARARAFLDDHGFDAVHLRGLGSSNRFHVLDPDHAARGAAALLSPAADAYVGAYKFDIRPAHDDRPYFANFFRWSTLPELWRLRAQGAAVLLDSGYLLLAAALALALPIALALVLLPLLALPRVHRHRGSSPDPGSGPGQALSRGDRAASIERMRAGAYFIGLGLAFLLIEIACLARLGLLVGHPLLALGAGLAGFLAFAGAGSMAAQRWLARTGAGAGARHYRRAVLMVGLGLAWHLATFPLALQSGATWPAAARGLLGLATIAPLAFAMGLPFALGLSRLAREAPQFVPWAWGLNGCASVVAAIAALLLAIEVGLTATLLIAFALYLLAAWLWRDTSAGLPAGT